MTVLRLVAFLCLAYVAGSVNFAVIVTCLASGRDIRSLGSGNPGTANVGRSIGRGWAALVFFSDLAKGLLPLLLARSLAFPQESWPHTFALAGVGMAAVGGHCRPLFYRFRGGRGAATAVGVYLFFIPAEIVLTMAISFAIAMLAFRKMKAPVARWTPILFVCLAPFLTWLFNSLLTIPLWGSVSLGGHPWHVIVAVFAVSCFLLLLNTGFFRGQLREIRDRPAGG
jgi:glycerol-3-phosphate acyltransferase PlsY